MIQDKLFITSDILESSLQAKVTRNDIIQNNIANVDTPGFKKKQVLFEEQLLTALDSSGIKTKSDLKNIQTKIVEKDAGFSYRIDENNVDIEKEMVDLYNNSTKFDTIITSVISSYKKITSVLNAK
jgi:flagellar basal-body rod protein FlgB